MNTTVKLIALRPHYYNRDLRLDEEYEATPEHAALLERTGASRRANDAPKSKKDREYSRRDMVAEK